MAYQRILLLSEGFGTGHTQAARALEDSLRSLRSGVETQVVELGSVLHPRLAPLLYGLYRWTLAHAPALYAGLYRGNRQCELSEGAKRVLHRILYRETEALIREFRPHGVVCTHPFPALTVARLKRMGRIRHEPDLPLAGVVTDYDAHASWLDAGIDGYCVSTDEVRQRFESLGVRPERIRVTGIPIHPRFWEQPDRGQVKRQLGLRPDVPAVLIMGGGWGLMDDGEVMAGTIAWRERLQLIYGFGSNRKALARFSQDPRFRHPNVKLLGYTDQVDLWMEAADLLITKPGGLTCSEAIAKGLPMLFYRPIPGQEEENALHFTGAGWGERMDGAHQLQARLERLLQQADRERAERLVRRERSDNGFAKGLACARAVLEQLGLGGFAQAGAEADAVSPADAVII